MIDVPAKLAELLPCEWAFDPTAAIYACPHGMVITEAALVRWSQAHRIWAAVRNLHEDQAGR